MKERKEEENSQFWEYVDGKPRISHSRIINFLEMHGFMRLKISNSNYVIVRKQNNRLLETCVGDIIHFIGCHLKTLRLFDVYEIFAKGVTTYISQQKLNLMKIENLPSDRDGKFDSNFYFENCYCHVTKDGCQALGYETLPIVIWENRIIKSKYSIPLNRNEGQFEIFCKNLTKGDDKRLLALKTILGYLLHRNREHGEMKAIILYDEKMTLNDLANGGTGKTLLSKAIGVFRDVETFDGKEIKSGSWFKNQRINLTTDVIVYDDLNKNVSLENFYSMITSGVEVEKKRQDAFFIDFEESPKILITSNYPVKGPGGSSDIRRRHEFEIANYYDADFTPEKEFGNRFFDKYWHEDEWSKFYQFMMGCVQDYLKYGLLNAPTLNLDKEKMRENSCTEFVEFADSFIEYNRWIDKRQFESDFKEFYPQFKVVSSHQISKWIQDYAVKNGGDYERVSSGGDYNFIIKRKEVRNV
ncbi:hypothetical protein SAMN06265371_108219 [Lutibacter agarilyticus]|uniref:SF3 helicase domain-containing protein n=1 Tax=Lutibacter agarilyticus TaxID=1109740 RepID=A0A238YDL7_9FLAO|nr:primase-helicase family protein [Lutibacter agarilyticus]SNR68703.1 hypothetical protein SAMN06265371_108219 [Lutibacter agarilyticus]